MYGATAYQQMRTSVGDGTVAGCRTRLILGIQRFHQDMLPTQQATLDMLLGA